MSINPDNMPIRWENQGVEGAESKIDHHLSDQSRSPKNPVGIVLTLGGVVVAIIALVGLALVFVERGQSPNRPEFADTGSDLPLVTQLESLLESKGNSPPTQWPQTEATQQQSVALLKELLVPMPEVLRPDLAPQTEDTSRWGKASGEGAKVTGGDIRPAGPWPDNPELTFSQFCSRCHLLPPADVEPRALWPAKIRQMYRYATGPRVQPPEAIPPIEAAIEYWTRRAPEQLLLSPDALGWPWSPLTFRKFWVLIPELEVPTAISCIRIVPWNSPDQLVIVISEMLHGHVLLWKIRPEISNPRVIGKAHHPSRVEVIDLDQDGFLDVLVADLGDFWPVDTDKGRVLWLRNRGNDQFETSEILSGLGRVNEVKAADFDGDGDLDLVVACFGNLSTGGLIYLENTSDKGTDFMPKAGSQEETNSEERSVLQFEATLLDDRPGWSDVPVFDFDGDGMPDFFALQSQEHERVLLFLNRGWGSFAEKLLHQAPHPRWGSTGIVPVDLEGDGDIDLLFNHGDAFQFPPVARPYHGVTWLENVGGIPFRAQRLAHLPAVHTSIPGDLDGDGDWDVVVSAFMPAFNPNWPDAQQLVSIGWLEQTGRGVFRRWSLERSLPYHPCGEVADLDGDSDVDIVLGNFSLFRFPQMPVEACLTILENLRKSPGTLEMKFQSWALPADPSQ
jgi:hypothetical protein